MIAFLSVILAAAIVGGVLLVALFDRRSPMPRMQRVGWCMMAAGLIWAGPARFLGKPADVADLLFLLGVLIVLLALHGPQLLIKADGLDGRIDGRLGVIPLHRGVHLVDGARPGRSAFSTRRGPLA